MDLPEPPLPQQPISVARGRRPALIGGPARPKGWRFRARLRAMYHGHSKAAIRFRLGVIALDLILIGFFVFAPILKGTRAFLPLDYSVAFLLFVDLTARGLAWRDLKAWIRRPIIWVDLFVLLTLLAPMWLFNLAFLRVLRLWTLFHSDFFWETVGRRYDDTRWEPVIRATATLVTFIFVVTGFVYTIFGGRHAGIEGYVDALYFTVATLTTTGFGDIVLPGTTGKLISIITMICGITLFVRLAQAIFKPNKVAFSCPTCGLNRHDPDAVHCKACGVVLTIPDSGL